MKRCANCFRYSMGQPPFCTHCGRTYDVRLCPRGHRNARGAQFCAECGSGDLSTPAPPATFLFHASEWAVRSAVVVTVVLIAISAVASVLWSLDWSAVAPSLVLLVLIVGILEWATTLIPGPLRKVGKHVGRAALKAMTDKRKSK